MYHIIFFDALPEKRAEVVKLVPEMEKAANEFDGVDFVGLFFPRGSDYGYALVAKYRDYATFENYYKSVTALREKAITLLVKQRDLFLDEIVSPKGFSLTD